jgi:hypothetical protein
MKSSDTNPYQSPHDVQNKVDRSAVASFVGTRRLKDEANLKQTTLALILLFAAFGGVLLFAETKPVPQHQEVEKFVGGSIFLLAALAGVVVNWGVRSYSPWAKIPLTILCILGLPLLPFGTGFASIILRVVYSREKPRILSVKYQAVVKANPHESDRISVMTWIAIVLLIILAISLIVIIQLPPEFRRPPHP